MKKYTFSFFGLVVLLFLALPVHAQYVKVEAGTHVKILSGSDFRASGNVEVASGGKLDIYGSVYVSGTASCTDVAGLIVHSASSGDGSFIFGAGSPKGTIMRFVSQGKWHQVSIPVTGATVNDFYFDKNPSTWLARRDIADSTWKFLTDLSEALPVGEGFDYYIENTDKTVAFSGTLYSGNFNLSGSTTPSLIYANGNYGGANLVGNPYAAPVKVTDDGTNNWTFKDMEKTVWVWDGDGANYKYANTDGAGNLTSGIIPIGQAFFVHVTGTSPEFTLPVARRVDDETSYFKSAKVQNGGPDSYFVLDVKKDKSSDEIWVTFGKNGTDRFDNGYDASKMFGSKKAPQLFIKEDSIKNGLSIDYLPGLKGTGRVVKVNFVPGVDGKQTFIGHTSRLDGVDVELEDLKTGIFHDFSNDSIYTFEGTKKDNPNRFLLHFGKVSGIHHPESGSANISIYAYNKAVYIYAKGTLQQGESRITIYDLMGRTIYNDVRSNASTIRIPMQLAHTYLIVRVVNQKNQIKVSKVYLQ